MTASARVALAACALAALAASSGCAAIQRLAPPGLVKHRDIAGDQPPHPIIVERIEARRAETEARFPNLSEMPTERPATLNAAERARAMRQLREQREALVRAVEADRAAVTEDNTTLVEMPGRRPRVALTIDEAAAALAEAVQKDREAAARDRLTPRESSETLPDADE